ncbi:MAG: DNA cytosine methyltransferase [Clostridia bacterium]|nr:DNA cytosine methyltransferase [Clostridia bacterium]
MKPKQTDPFSCYFVDSFAGGGGASTGIEMATGHPIDIAINHDQSAILMHKRNHPYTQHYREDVFAIDPVSACAGHPVRLAWFSPDCKHFSRAKGAALVDKKIRGLAWIVLRWAALVRPEVIMLENVPEFVTWGPVRKGKPVKKKAGQTFKRWYQQLSDLGYQIEYRELCAADYGTPTIRTRFCLIARCDGQPIVWPERTHAPRDSEDVRGGKLLPWRSAAEIIDWTIPGYSIFESKAEIRRKFGVNAVRPLAGNTMSRIAHGCDKFVIRSAEPYIVSNNANNAPHSIHDPVPTVTTGNRNFLADAKITPFIAQQKFGNAPQDVQSPLTTVTSVGAHELVAPYLTQYHGAQGKSDVRGQDLRKPIMTVDAANRYALVVPILTQYFSTGQAHDVSEPLNTVTTKDRENLALAHLAHFKGKDKGQDLRQPLMTITQSVGQFAEIRTQVVRYESGANLGYWPQVRDMFNAYCGYHLAEDELLLILIRGTWYFISDITLRMLTPRELYNAMGFPADYIIDTDPYGNPISRADQVARCGNAVCPPLAEALVRANLPECPARRFGTMDALYKAV